MKKIENVDILSVLEHTVSLHTKTYKEDLQEDAERLIDAGKAAACATLEDRTFLCLIRQHGTYCLPERRVMMKGTPANVIWCYYSELHTSEKCIAYAVEVSGLNTEGRPVGTMYPLDYIKHADMMKRCAVQAENVKLIYERGERIQPASAPQVYDEGDGPGEYGRLLKTIWLPNDEEALRLLLRTERDARRNAKAMDAASYMDSLAKKGRGTASEKR